MRYYNKSTNEVLKYLKSNPEVGLSTEDVEQRRKKYGLNEFQVKEGKSLMEEISDSIMEPMILILLRVLSGSFFE